VHSATASIWSLCLLFLLLAGMVYPLVAPYGRYAHTDASHPKPYLTLGFSLDGMAYLQTCRPPNCDFDTSSDYEAIRWLNENVQGDPVLVEAFGNDYSYGSRISTFTGIPTIIGWAGHEMQWRVNWIKQSQVHSDEYNQRGADIDVIYTNPSPATVLTVMARYNAQYLYVGDSERAKYPAADLTRFGTFMQVVYSVDGVTIYKVK
jgi:uncharacterized membrane protein